MSSILLYLEQEPNPFEQSFHHSNEQPEKALLDLTSTSAPFSTNTIRRNLETMSVASSVDIQNLVHRHSSMITSATSMNPTISLDSSPRQQSAAASKKAKLPKKGVNDEEKRKNFLERNRQAALKCRQRKKRWLIDLQTKVEYLTSDNEQLQIQCALMRDEMVRLQRMIWTQKETLPASKDIIQGLQPLPSQPLAHRSSDALLHPMVATGPLPTSLSSPPFSVPSSSSSPTLSFEQELLVTSVFAPLDYNFIGQDKTDSDIPADPTGTRI